MLVEHNRNYETYVIVLVYTATMARYIKYMIRMSNSQTRS